MRPFFNPAGYSLELLYTLIVIVLCFFIYYKTREIYSLSKHPGIGFFRNAFLFFGIAYIFRFVFHLFKLSKLALDIHTPKHLIGPASLLIIGYLGTVAIFSLTLSTIWKKIKIRYIEFLIHIVAAIIAIIVFLTRSVDILVITQILLLVISIFLSYINSRKSKRFKHNYVIYILLFAFWIINLTVLTPRPFMPLELKVVAYIVSIAIFLFIFYRVSKWTK